MKQKATRARNNEMKKKPILKSESKVAHMVWVQGRGEPTKIQESFDVAYAEAERLAIKEPNRLVRVFQIVAQVRGEVKPVSVPIEVPLPANWGKVNDIEF